MVTSLIFKKLQIRKWEVCTPVKVNESIYNGIKVMEHAQVSINTIKLCYIYLLM